MNLTKISAKIQQNPGIQKRMNQQITNEQLSVVDMLLQQLDDQYMAVHSQNITMPKENIEPEDDPQNPYQPLEFDGEDSEGNQNEESNQDEKEQNEADAQMEKNKDIQQKVEGNQQQDVKKQLQSMRIAVQESNPEVKQQLIQYPPTPQQIYTNLPHKQFQIDQTKIKSFALSLSIDQPDWLKDQTLCKKRLQELFTKQKNQKAYTKI